MLDRAAPYSILGLLPDADRDAVDRAYRTLMKLHHPDLGGDPQRAASINRAYAEITRPTALAEPIESPGDLASAIYERRMVERRTPGQRAPARRPRWPLGLAAAAVLGLVAYVEREPLGDAIFNFGWSYFPSLMADPVADDGSSHVESTDTVYTAVRPATIIEAVAAARSTLARGGLDLAADHSQRCYHHVSTAASFGGLDKCLAFDDAVLLVAGAAAADRRGFGAASLTSRQLAAGRTLGGDFAGIEERLDRIRLMTLKVVEPMTQIPDLPPERPDVDPVEPELPVAQEPSRP